MYAWSSRPEAEDHLDELYRYIAKAADPEDDARYVDNIVTYCEGLAEFPHRGLARTTSVRD